MNTIQEGYIAVCKKDGQVAYLDYDDMSAGCPYFVNRFFYGFIKDTQEQAERDAVQMRWRRDYFKENVEDIRVRKVALIFDD